MNVINLTKSQVSLLALIGLAFFIGLFLWIGVDRLPLSSILFLCGLIASLIGGVTKIGSAWSLNVIREITPPLHIYYSKKWLIALLAYAIGLIGSATSLGLLLGSIGLTLRSFSFSINKVESIQLWIGAIAVIALIYAMQELNLIRFPSPQIHWQVPIGWVRYGKTKQAFLYGVVLGSGIFTYIPYKLFYVLLLLEISLGPGKGAVLGFLYGVARFLPTLTSAVVSRLAKHDVNYLAEIINGHLNSLQILDGITLGIIGILLIANLL